MPQIRCSEEAHRAVLLRKVEGGFKTIEDALDDLLGLKQEEGDAEG